ncbi:MAG: gfo/Idh/MocA family oxidoreductase [Chloroflexi bacterium]|nr:MAG: gfo/Idh/MocA family oxidoreductase [Chloroflexota bacterium]
MKTIGVGVIGMGWMGTVHSRAYKAVQDRFYDWGVGAELIICSDSVPTRAKAAKERLGFAQWTTDWQEVIAHPDVQAVSITTPNFLHKEMALAAIAARKHVFCEKPVGILPAETAEVYHAACDAGVKSFVGLNYRWAPLVQFVRQLITDGRLGEITNYHGRFFAMYASDPLGQLTWRFLAEQSGTGILGDVMPHVADMALFLAGPMQSVVSNRQTFVRERPLPVPGRGTHFSRGLPEDPKGEVTNEDYTGVLVKFANGARGALEVSRTIYGPKCEMSFEVYGTKGAAKWNFETMNELQLYLPDETGVHEGFVRILAGPQHPFHERFNPGPGIGIGYEDLKVIEMGHFLRSIAENTQYEPSFAQAYGYAQVHDAIMRSWESGTWEALRPL